MLAYFAVGHNANHFVHEKLAQLLHSNLKCTFRKENFARKKMKNLRKEVLQLFLDILPSKLSLLTKKTINNFAT